MKISKSLLVESEVNNYYVDIENKKVLYLNTELKELFSLYKENNENLQSFENIEDNYSLRKFKFLLDNYYLSSKKETIKELNVNDVDLSIKNTKHIVFEVTEKCNLNCKYCYYGDFYKKSQSDKKNKVLDVNLAKKILINLFEDELLELPQYFSVSFYGGEPLLNFEFIQEIVLFTKENWPKTKFRYGMTTNATLIRKYIDFLVDEQFDLLISIDGNEKHNSYRVFNNGKPSFSIVYKNLLYIKEKYSNYYDKRININSVITNRSTYNESFFFIKENLDKSPLITQEINPVGVLPEKKCEFEKILNTATAKAEETPYYFFKGFRKKYKTYTELLTQNDEINTVFFINNPTATCLPFEVKLFVSAEGFIRPCEKVGKGADLGKYKLYNVRLDKNYIHSIYYDVQKVTNKICSKCYNIYCTECLISHYFNGAFKCPNFISETDSKKNLSKYLIKIENNPYLLFESPEIK